MNPTFDDHKHHFARVMLHKLEGAVGKGNWQEVPINDCAKLCLGEYEELVEAARKPFEVWERVKEYADVANFAMFIYNNLDDTFFKRTSRHSANIPGIRNFLANLRFPMRTEPLRKDIERLIQLTSDADDDEEFEDRAAWEKAIRQLCLHIGSRVCWNALNLDSLATLPELKGLPEWVHV